jgi:hypothetical protein
MLDAFIDVQLEIAASSITDRDTTSRFIIERSRHEAEVLAERSGATVRTDRAPEIVVRRAMHSLTGDVLLVASRWAVLTPTDPHA